ncbi:MAG TPA: winged helix-turn-helix transcriptional regulator [Methanospirillum sp.]|nr:winged helix-turn-helix transcriptional regulator [Methanospirillum sp.]
MKLLALAIIIGLCLLAGAPLAVLPTISEQKRTCCMGDSSNGSSRSACHPVGSMNGVQTCSCRMQTVPSGSPPSPGPGSCNGNCNAASSIQTQPPTIIERLRRFTLNGYRRVTGKNLLDHETRRLLYNTIVSMPGVDLRTLTEITRVNENTIRYHLDRMVGSGVLHITLIGGSGHYFENHGKYSEQEQLLLSRMSIEESNRILQIVGEKPGLSRGELASIIGVSGPTITRSVHHLTKEGLIRCERDGRFSRYYPSWADHTIKSGSILA